MFGIGKKRNQKRSCFGSFISGLDIPENVVVLVTLTEGGGKVTINAPSLKKEYSETEIDNCNEDITCKRSDRRIYFWSCRCNRGKSTNSKAKEKSTFFPTD